MRYHFCYNFKIHVIFKYVFGIEFGLWWQKIFWALKNEPKHNVHRCLNISDVLSNIFLILKLVYYIKKQFQSVVYSIQNNSYAKSVLESVFASQNILVKYNIFYMFTILNGQKK